MKNILKLEELAMFGLSIYLFTTLDFAWWWYPALILTPDIGMVGYVYNARMGALTYNLFHHKGVAILVLLIGWCGSYSAMILAGIILFGHASMDRMFGYGLKYSEGFRYTHLGELK